MVLRAALLGEDALGIVFLRRMLCFRTLLLFVGKFEGKQGQNISSVMADSYLASWAA